ncbi:helix-turn-helix transcriptional regulator [Sporosarcina sp. NPDC096371]|uniref:helix-turn-helix transcriptional regulator n=1 Tax=Sporosarcina sp. NPDC096371 TaxID=3364530 RepID=UPI00382BB0F3
MKIDRLLTMTIMLLNRKKVTAQEFADFFHVSVRTIYRDIDTLSNAGIPVISYQGANGGIRLLEGYRMDKQTLTKDEITSISIALKSVFTSYEDLPAKAVLEKLERIAVKEEKPAFDYLFVDDSPWGQNARLKEKVTLLKQAITTTTCVSFSYASSDANVTFRTIEPHTLVQKGRTWYVYGYCLLRNAFRLFKLARIQDLQLCHASFIRKEVKEEELPWDQAWYAPENIVTLRMAFHPDYRFKLEELFGTESIDNHQSIVTIDIPEDEWLYGFILSFADKVEVLEPVHIRNIIQQKVRNIVDLYNR